MNKPKTPETNPERPTALAGATGSAALLQIIKTCEDYQNADTEGMEMEQHCDDGYRAICKVITIASGALAEIEAQPNADVSDRRDNPKR